MAVLALSMIDISAFEEVQKAKPKEKTVEDGVGELLK